MPVGYCRDDLKLLCDQTAQCFCHERVVIGEDHARQFHSSLFNRGAAGDKQRYI
jgi:hypothetical protein